MPRHEPSPRFALLSDFDARPYSGVLFTRRNSSNVQTDVSLFEESSIVFDDIIQFLNGKGVGPRYTYEAAITQNIFTGETFTVGINEDDHIFINRDNGQSLTVSVGSQSTALFGAVNGTYSNGQVTFPYDWRRGNEFVSNDELVLLTGVFPQITTFPHLRAFQDVGCVLRERTGNDNLCLEQVEDELFTPTTNLPVTQWLLTEEGHVMQVINTYLNPYAASFSWVDLDFRNRLGFSGNETWVSAGTNLFMMVADNPAPGVLIPTRPYETHHLKFERPVSKKRKIGGGYTSNFVGNYVTSILSFRLDALFDQKDEYRHYSDSCGKYFYEGAAISFYQDWGDTRRALRTAEVVAGQDAYSLYYTSESNGMFGIIKGHIATMSGDLAYESNLKRRVAVTMEIEHHG